MYYVVTVNEKEQFQSVKMKLIAQGLEVIEETPRFLTLIVKDPVHISSELVIPEIKTIPGVRNARKEEKYESL